MAAAGKLGRVDRQVIGAVVDVHVRRSPAGDPERARDRPTTATAWCSKWPSTSARTPCAPSPWTPPKAWCAAQRSDRHRRADLGAGRRRDARPHHERHRRAGGRSRPGQDRSRARHPPGGADLRRAVVGSADPRHRHQGASTCSRPTPRRQDRPVRRRRRRQDRADPGTDQQRRQGARRLFGVRRRRRAHPRGQRPLSRDDRIRRQQEGRRRGLQVRPGVRPDERAAGRPRPRRRSPASPSPSISATRARTCCSSSTTSSASRRRARKCRRCSAVSRRPWAISRRSPPTWARCRSASPPPTRARSPRCRRSTCRPTT